MTPPSADKSNAFKLPMGRIAVWVLGTTVVAGGLVLATAAVAGGPTQDVAIGVGASLFGALLGFVPFLVLHQPTPLSASAAQIAAAGTRMLLAVGLALAYALLATADKMWLFAGVLMPVMAALAAEVLALLPSLRSAQNDPTQERSDAEMNSAAKPVAGMETAG